MQSLEGHTIYAIDNLPINRMAFRTCITTSSTMDTIDVLPNFELFGRIHRMAFQTLHDSKGGSSVASPQDESLEGRRIKKASQRIDVLPNFRLELSPRWSPAQNRAKFGRPYD